MRRLMSTTPRSGWERIASGFTAIAFVMTQLILPRQAEASHLGSSTASAGSAPPPAATAIQGFQPDLFTGRATTAIPILVPPGRKGVQPILAMAYSSAGRNGWLGVGWSLDMGFIERSTKNGVPKYDSSDVYTFMLHGASSDLVQLTDGTYRAKEENLFLRFQSNGVAGWEVRDKSGTRYLFGEDVNSQIENQGRVFRWGLDKIIDIDGNTIVITYTKDHGELYLTQIRYTGHEPTGLSPSNQVDFILETRPDIDVMYRSGIGVTTAKRLKAIEAKATVDGTVSLARRYELSYTQSPRTGRSLLTNVTHVGADGVTKAPPMTFAYQAATTPTYTLISNSPQNFGKAAWNVRKANLDTGHENFGCVSPYSGLPWGQSEVATSSKDFGCLNATVNADGSIQISGCQDHFLHAWTWVFARQPKTISLSYTGAEACLFREDASGIQNLGSGASVPLQAGWSLIHLTGYHQHESFTNTMSSPLKTLVDIMSPQQFSEPQLAGDVDGNGITDLMTFDAINGRWSVSCAQTCTLQPAGTWLVGFGDPSRIPMLGDWNGDGKTDIALFKNDTSGGSWQFATSSGASFYQGAPAPHTFGRGTPLVGDFNGDGQTDLGMYDNGTWLVALASGPSWSVQFTDTGSFTRTWGSSSSTPLTGDFNGDGLTNIAMIQGGTISVALSDGTTFIPQPQAWLTGFGSGNYTTADFNGDGLTDIAYYDKSTGRVVYAASTGSSFAASQTLPVTFDFRADTDQLQVGDFNGDGIADPAVFTAIGSSELAISQGSLPDVLTEIHNGVGGTTTLSYQLSTQLAETTLPFVIPVVSRVTTDDGMGHSYTTTYMYSGGVYDLFTKEFRGFAKVEARDPDANVTITQFLQDEFMKGHPSQIEFRDAAGTLWTKQQNQWNWFWTLSPDGLKWSVFVFLMQTDTFTYDGDATFKQTESQFQYDSFGNIVRVDELGDMSVTGDERHTWNAYAINETAWIIDRLAHTKTINAMLPGEGGRTVYEKWWYYDGRLPADKGHLNDVVDTTPPSKGHLTATVDYWDTPDPEDPNPLTQFTYDQYGNIATVIDALGHTTTNAYDGTGTFLVQVTNPLGHTRKLTYDPRLGQVTSSTDANGVTATTQYDALGRVIKVIGPNDTAVLPTISYEYDLSTVPTRTSVHTRIQSGQSAELVSSTFADGLGRTIQTRSPAQDPTKHVVTGTVEFNTRGLVIKQWPPYLSNISSTYVPRSAEPLAASLAFVSYVYDPLGRATQVTDPDGSVTTTTYDDWVVTVTDANGHKTRRTHDAFGRVVQVEEFNGIDVYTTKYTYGRRSTPNALLDELTQVTDASGNTTILDYDTMGRKVRMNDPDMGVWTYKYDALNNLIEQQDARGVVIAFTYDALNRLTQKSYSTIAADASITNPGTVTYTYDDPAKPFSKGKLSSIHDSSGTSSFEYDNLGRLVKESKTIDGVTYTIQRAYDLLGRLTSLAYPDNEVGLYTYNLQGGIQTVSLKPPASSAKPIISDVVYNAAGQMTKITYGNGVTTDYTYNPQTLRLSSLVTRNSSLATLQDFSYAFDPVGNVAGITDHVHTGTQTFQYDDLSRLTQAVGSYGTFTYAYDPIGNMTQKEGVTLQYNKVYELVDPITGYQWRKPHAVTGTSNGVNFSYDKNGNLLEKRPASCPAPPAPCPTSQLFMYDAENRLVNAASGGSSAPQTVTVTLAAGWNFFSLPLIPTDRSIGAIFGTQLAAVKQVSRFNSSTQAYEHFVKEAAFNQFDSLEAGVGYAVYVTAPITLTLTGSPLTGVVSRQLPAGPTSVPPHPDAPAPTPGLPRHLLASGDQVYSFVNLPWGRIPGGTGGWTATYGLDFGTTAWGNFGVASNAQIDRDFDALAQAGVEGLRWFLLADGRNLIFDGSGTPTGRAPGFSEDLWAALDKLDARNLGVIFALLDGNTWAAPPTGDGRVPAGGHAQVLEDPAKRQALEERVIKPMCADLRAWLTRHPDRSNPVAAIDLGNELEAAVTQGVSWASLSAYVRETVALVHQELPGVPVTVGALSAETLVSRWTDQALGVVAGSGLDFYSFHHYGTETPYDLNRRLGLAQLGKRLYLQEFSAKQAETVGVMLNFLSELGGRRYGNFRTGWLSGSLPWSAYAQDAQRPTDLARFLRDFRSGLEQTFYAPPGVSWHVLGNPLATSLTVAQLLNGLDASQIVHYTGGGFAALSQTDVLAPGAALFVQVTGDRTWSLPRDPTSTTRFGYDGDGGRVKVIGAQGSTTFLGQSFEVGPTGTTTKYVFAGAQRIAAKDSTGVLRFYQGDHLGSSNVITDGTGNLVELAEYTPYGSLSRREGSVTVPQKFTGKRLDPTGLYFYEARYYDPSLGRFITPDWFVPNPNDPQDLNRYTYAGNNPLKYTDPTGHFKFKNLFKWIGRGLTFLGAFLMATVNPIGASLLFWSGVTSFLPGRTWQTVSTSLSIASLAWTVGTGLVDAARQGGNWFTAGGRGVPQSGPDNPNWLVTGVNTTPEGAQAWADATLPEKWELFRRQGITPSVFQQGTHGTLSDVSEAASLKAFGGGRAAQQLAGDLGKWAAQNKAVNLLLHSEGALIGKNALNIFSHTGQLVEGSRLWAFGSASFEGALRAAFLRAGGDVTNFFFRANPGDLVPALTANLNPLRTIYAAGATMLEGFREHSISTYYERAGGQ